jgi:anti-anti-sigma factor
MIEVETSTNPERPCVLRLSGDLDLAAAAPVRAAIDDLPLHAQTTLLLDLRDVPFCDSCGLTLLLQTKRVVEAAGATLVLRDPTPQLKGVLQLTCLWEHFVVA